ncbi:Gfo/Idh/MocA family oxidoreductase [Hymenobacter sp. BT186]|uniref:Gfo/Idh/MocA family oxidoreductase n=1 Tax=Hymenobacter telluris TaxID=2816474 RepID=A0A939EXA0_9BACT|nr:Gfo/Idh/MocA family oxidoreductase [Hymenobacter telluris]MBO0359549.1 Gfo/Idh/MocA family oxidoreductase [Hymenobacter telluris]MBW3375575.1 Gfo/Idh/MocA family oxidoreductase [Hymenobacter norwichensis]
MKLRLGMIGGGQGSFIGAVHRIAASLDGLYELVAGAFSSNPDTSRATGQELGLAPDRVYASYQELVEQEAQRPAEERVQVISIVTPNHLHFAPAKLALENGFDVVLDKPITFSLAEAQELAAVLKATGRKLCLTHTYTGYPMLKEARHLVAAGAIGTVRKVYVEYPQGWLSTPEESGENKQAAWRTDPARSGIAGAMGDIGTHAFNLLEYVSGLHVTELCADINTVVPNRRLDDDGAVLLKLGDGASGVLVATQIAAGEENNLRLRIYGEKGGLDWQQADANTLLVKWLDRPTEVRRTGAAYLSAPARHNSRIPPGHPEGYLEAFANLYRNFALTLLAEQGGPPAPPEAQDYPGIEEGLRGMAFIENVIASGRSEQKWTRFSC